MAALKAIAAIPQILERIESTQVTIANNVTEKKIAKINAKVSEITARLPHGKDRNEILDMVDELNRTVSK